MNIINIEHITKRFGDKFLFEDASFGVQEGDGASEEKRVKNTGSIGGPDFRMSDDERLRSGRLGAFQ